MDEQHLWSYPEIGWLRCSEKTPIILNKKKGFKFDWSEPYILSTNTMEYVNIIAYCFRYSIVIFQLHDKP